MHATDYDTLWYVFSSSVFFSSSKSLIKLTKSRIDVIMRKRRATEKFLKKDIADLLLNGLDINAYGRVIVFFFFVFLFSAVSGLGWHVSGSMWQF